jgi:hypothetical protein
MRNVGMRERSHEARAIPAVRVVSTPVPKRRLYGDIAEQCRALFDDALGEPVPEHLLVLATLSERRFAAKQRRAEVAGEDG